MTFYFKRKQYAIDTLFVLSLFAVFAITSLLLVYSGTKAYENITVSMENSFSSRTAISYIDELVKQNNSKDNINVGEVEGITALKITEMAADIEYVRYIYFYDGYLRELFIPSDMVPTATDGQRLVRLKNFTLIEIDGLLHFTVTDDNDNNLSLTLSTL